MTGITMRCGYCGRPIVGPAVYGGQGEPYHVECAQSPKAQKMPSLASVERAELTILRRFVTEVQQAEDMTDVRSAVDRLHSE